MILYAENICAVMDMQGFMLGKSFFPREISIVNDKFQYCFEIDSKIDNKIKTDYNKAYKFQQKNIHGISADLVLKDTTHRILQNSELKRDLCCIYAQIKSVDKFIVAVKNQQLSKLLTLYKIPFINLEDSTIGGEVCPPRVSFDQYSKNFFCSLHFALKNQNKNIRCSLRKGVNIWNWINNQTQSDFIYSQNSIELNKFLQSLR